MGNYTISEGVENSRRGRQARNLTTNVPKILDLKSSSEQIFTKNRRWVRLQTQKELERAKKGTRFWATAWAKVSISTLYINN